MEPLRSIAQPSICQLMYGFAKKWAQKSRAMISYLSTLNIIPRKFVTVEGIAAHQQSVFAVSTYHRHKNKAESPAKGGAK